jgi:RimJ/RimL family protein N-acetyltransferase
VILADLRRLGPSDAAEFARFRLAGAAQLPNAFRFHPDDDFSRSIDATQARLAVAHVVGAYEGKSLVAIGAVEPFASGRLAHKWLLWGMFVARPGAGLGERIVQALLNMARQGGAQSVQLTVMADNARAVALYERCGFCAYGREPQSVMRNDGLADELLMRLVFAKEPLP